MRSQNVTGETEETREATIAPDPPILPAPRSEQRNVLVRARTWLRAALDGGLGEALWLFLTLRIAFSLFALLASVLNRLPAPCNPNDPITRYDSGVAFRLLGVWQRWDACWYQRIATVGYRPEDPSVAFFPLYPLLMRLVSIPLAGNLTLSGLAVSGVAYIAAVTGLYQLVALDFDEEIARRAVLYLSVFPVAFFLFAPFTEALFLALVVWTLLLARRRRWGWVMVTALLLGLTRTQGILIGLPLAYEVYRYWRERQGPRRLFPAAITPVAPFYGFLLFISYSKTDTGWTTFQAQTRWGLTARLPWQVIQQSWTHLRQRGDVVETLNLTLLILFAILLIGGARRLPLVYTFYFAPQLLLIGTRVNFFSPLQATSRYVLVLFPAFVLLACWGQRRRLHYSWLLLSVLLLGFFLYAFLNGKFIA